MSENSIKNRFNEILDHKEYREIIWNLFYNYNDEVQELIELASVDNDIKRQENIANEIYAIFHHLNKSLLESDTIKESLSEINSANKTHLKRITLDAYKIIITSILEEDKNLVDILEDAILDDDFRSSLDPEYIDNIRNLSHARRDIKNGYLRAKKFERKGKFNEAKKEYKKIVQMASKQREIMDLVTSDRHLVFAIKRIHRKDKQEKRIRQFTIKTIAFSCFLTFAFTLASALIINKYLINNTFQPKISAKKTKK